MRMFSVGAGVAAIAAAAYRHVRSFDTLEKVVAQIAHPAERAFAAITWHGLTYSMAVLGVALIVSAWASRETAQSLAMLATAIFGGLAAIMGVFAGVSLGDPFAFYPVFALLGLAALSALAAVKA